MSLYKKVNFKIAYEWASNVRDHIDNYEDLDRFYLKCKDEIHTRIKKYNKSSILHLYIFYILREYYDFRINDMLNDNEFEIIGSELESILDAYDVVYEGKYIDILKYEDFLEDYESEYTGYIMYLQGMLNTVTDTMVNDIFYLLFGDREFLLAFIYNFSNIVKRIPYLTNEDFMKRDGVLKRDEYFPSWLRNAVIYRDKGICLGCGKDLTGTIRFDDTINLDHIVPLAQGGVNDPVNIQLLCESCNKSKLDKKIYTLDKYPSYW